MSLKERKDFAKCKDALSSYFFYKILWRVNYFGFFTADIVPAGKLLNIPGCIENQSQSYRAADFDIIHWFYYYSMALRVVDYNHFTACGFDIKLNILHCVYEVMTPRITHNWNGLLDYHVAVSIPPFFILFFFLRQEESKLYLFV